MDNSLLSYAHSRDNNFNLIRFVAAFLVLYSHSFALVIGSGDAEPLRATLGMTWGTIAVDLFFITSGFLITSSFLIRDNLIAFVWARFLRIYPALIVAIFLTVFGLGLFFTSLKTSDYLSDFQTLKYLIKNCILFFGVEHTLPGVFLETPYKQAVNGSLWTLPYEVKMYLLLVLILVCVRFLSSRLEFITIRNSILVIALASVILHLFNNSYSVLPEKFVRLFSMFFVGAAFYIWKDKVRLSSKALLIGLPLLAIASVHKDAFLVVYCLLLPFLVFYLAYVPKGFIRGFNRLGDYSYGMYIYAFPVQQSIVALLPGLSVLTMIVVSFAITLVLAVLSWHVVEKRSLKMKGEYAQIERVANFFLFSKGSRQSN